MIKILRAVSAVVLALAIGAAVAGSVAAQPSGPLPALTGHVRIMIAGDSTAAGIPTVCPDGSPFGDRWTLGHWLRDAAGLDVEFVGSQVATCAAPFGRSEGHSGWTIGMLADNIGAFLTASPADILILRVGVNDATSTSGWHSAAQMSADYLRLINNARAAIPTIRIGASEVIPPEPMATTNPVVRADLAKASVTAREFNRGLRGIVAPYGDAVHALEIGRITPLLLADGLHPSGQGYDAIAYIQMQQSDGIRPWLSDRDLPVVKLPGVAFDPWR